MSDLPAIDYVHSTAHYGGGGGEQAEKHLIAIKIAFKYRLLTVEFQYCALK